MRVERTGYARNEPAADECRHLVARNRNADRARNHFVLFDRAQDARDARTLNDEESHQHDHDDRPDNERELAGRDGMLVQIINMPKSGGAVGAEPLVADVTRGARPAIPHVMKNDPHGFREGNRCNGEMIAFQPQGRDANEQARRRAREPGDEYGGKQIESPENRQARAYIGPHAEESGLTDRDLSAHEARIDAVGQKDVDPGECGNGEPVCQDMRSSRSGRRSSCPRFLAAERSGR